MNDPSACCRSLFNRLLFSSKTHVDESSVYAALFRLIQSAFKGNSVVLLHRYGLFLIISYVRCLCSTAVQEGLAAGPSIRAASGNRS